MKLQYLTALVTVLFCATISFAQKNRFALSLKDGTLVPEANVTSARINAFHQRTLRLNNKVFAVLQFQQLPSEQTKKELAAAGIQLLDYIPNNAYTVSITGKPDIGLLQRLKARAVVSLSPQQKMHPALSKGVIPAWAQKVAGTVDVQASFPKTFSAAEVLTALKEKNIDILSTQYQQYNIVTLRVAVNRLSELAGLPFIAYVEPVPPPDEPLNNNSRVGSRANMLNASIANGGKGLNGEGVVIGIGDEGNVTHTDLSGRLISRGVNLDVRGHAHHTHGTAAGGGIINELYRGYASKAIVVSDWFQNIISKAPVYVKDYGMVITSNSYGGNFSCDYAGTYNMSSQLLDQQAFDFPDLQHVFAAGNDGDKSCSPYPGGFKTVLGGYQSAKNIITVGNANDLGSLFTTSARGPVKDGRIKPEIVADGAGVTSTYPNNGYGTLTGTSMASPAVAGGLALLYQRYRQLHGNADPKSALMKAIICNGATDKGNDGPDYSYGFGYLNLVRSLDILENNHYFMGNSTNGSVNEQMITVPATTSQVKIMLYWHDPAASILSSQELVNDLDLEVIDPSGNSILPRKLDTTATHVNVTATTGADHINNIEQVVINNPASGNYTVRVKGTAIAQNPEQEYAVAYDIIPVSLQLTYPVGGEGLTPSTSVKISWDSYGDPSSTFTLQYSVDNGTSWYDIATNIAATTHYNTWKVPATITDKARVRVLKNGTTQISASNAFTIIGVPAITLAATQCEGYIAFNWKRVATATDYEVMMLRGDEMVSLATTTDTFYTVSSLSKDSTYWVSVRAKINGKPGTRAFAVSRQPNTGNCSGAISDNDLKLSAIIAPQSGRKYTATSLTAATPVRIQIKNLDDAPASNFTLSYCINDGAWVTESVSGIIAAGDVYTHTFATTADMAAVGNYKLVAVVKNSASDVVTANDTLVSIIKHLDNQPINLATPFLDDLENTPTATYQKGTIGITNLDRYDFNPSSLTGRLQTFVNTGISYSGSKAFTMDKSEFSDDSSINYLTGTFNLSRFNVNDNDLRLDFRYFFMGQSQSDSNKIWIRGKDTDPWIEAFRFINDDAIAASSSYKLSPSIQIADSLKSKGQDFSSSFQIRWGQNAKLPFYDKSRLYSIDDIHIYEAFHDMQLISIDTPLNLSCDLGSAVPLKITIRNNSHTILTNIPVKFSVNGGDWIAETVPSLSGNTTIPYTFTHTLDLSNTGLYSIRVLVDYPDDNYRLNDTLVTDIHIAPLITSFPYLQNFEGGDGNWYSTGSNSSWEYGTPASVKINRAASGAKVWKTRLSGNYNDEESSYLYSPCFDISSLKNPTLSFSMAMDLEDCEACDATWIEYTTDNKTWKLLADAASTGTNWYNAANNTTWSRENYTRWHVATVNLPKEGNVIRFRFVMSSDEFINKEGIALDDIHVYDNAKGIFEGTTPPGALTQDITGGTNWIDFETGGKLIASIQPNNQNLGSTTVKAFINTGTVRDTSHQYYHDRNITIQPQHTALNDSVTVRFYFTDAEAEALINAANCADCIKPANAYELGVSKYSNTNTALENGTMKDNAKGQWLFINPDEVMKVPFDKGYYAEFKVKSFSEFWLNKTAFSSFTPLPVSLIDFTATKSSNNVLLQWQVAMETNMEGYEVEVARSNRDLQLNHFEKIGAIKSTNNPSPHTYAFTDEEAQKSGARYYRIKIIEETGAIKYSPVRSVLFNSNEKWIVFPNPSSGIFHITYQLPAGETMDVKITDVTGRTVQQFKIIGDGFAQKQLLDLSGKQYASGVYLLQATNGIRQLTDKLYKQ